MGLLIDFETFGKFRGGQKYTIFVFLYAVFGLGAMPLVKSFTDESASCCHFYFLLSLFVINESLTLNCYGWYNGL